MKQTMLLRLVFASACLLGLGGTVGCNKPSPEKCRTAILNIQTLLGTDKSLGNFDLEGEVRRCRGGSKRESVECAIKATTIDELMEDEGFDAVVLCNGLDAPALLGRRGDHRVALHVFGDQQLPGLPGADVDGRRGQVAVAADVALTHPYWNPAPLAREALLALLQRAYRGEPPI